MITIKSTPGQDVIKHECESHRDGDWIIFRCPLCPDYERRFNWRTDEMKVKGDHPRVSHSGKYYPHELKSVFEYPN
ncbi:MAG TPA: hypothetical protein ENK44_04000 [Caldithrix abyssi]|uniref:Uncharacterized protein n=1 Tax=Caldithrix abyssi TaxID=187145 RepID=A0A7V4WU20_CALAY|nr:hypothetical protein [Caldithrix abyssi]